MRKKLRVYVNLQAEFVRIAWSSVWMITSMFSKIGPENEIKSVLDNLLENCLIVENSSVPSNMKLD